MPSLKPAMLAWLSPPTEFNSSMIATFTHASLGSLVLVMNCQRWLALPYTEVQPPDISSVYRREAARCPQPDGANMSSWTTSQDPPQEARG
jgi:hypothetical protein